MSDSAILDRPAIAETAGLRPGEFHFSNRWFETSRVFWDILIPQINPRTILEIGSFEGASACYLIQKLAKLAPLELHCVDTWEGGVEHKDVGLDMLSVETTFKHNIHVAISSVPQAVNLVAHKGYSDVCLANLVSQNRAGYFDMVYVDGSHQAPDVLADAVLGFKLLKVGGIMIFDDYLWAENLAYGRDPLRCPKPAIDAFVNCYFRKVNVIPAPLYQLYVQKLSD